MWGSSSETDVVGTGDRFRGIALRAALGLAVAIAMLACSPNSLADDEETLLQPSSRADSPDPGRDAGAPETSASDTPRGATTTPRRSQTSVAPRSAKGLRFVDIAVGEDFACGLTRHGTLECWGAMSSWSAGSLPSSVFVAVSVEGNSITDARITERVLSERFIQIAAGDRHACALNDSGTVSCWGSVYHHSGAAPSGKFVQVVADGSATCALRASGSFVCWGPVVGTVTADYAESPREIRVARLSEDGRCGLTFDDRVECWYHHSGYNEPVEIRRSGGRDGTYVHLGDECGVRADLSVTCWDVAPPDRSRPLGESFVQTSDLCGVAPDGSLECWGTGQYGRANRADMAPEGRFARVSAGPFRACGLRVDGRVRCWGAGYGSGPEPPAREFSAVEIGYSHPCGLTVEGGIECWSRRYLGEVPGEDGWRAPSPGPLPSGAFTQLSAGADGGEDVACAIAEDGHMACWTYYGMTGAPSGVFTSVSVGHGIACAITTVADARCWQWSGAEVEALASPPGKFAQLSASGGWACGVRLGGELECWSRSDAQPVPPPAGRFTDIALSRQLGCAVDESGSLTCWRPDPEPPLFASFKPPMGEFVQVAVADTYGCALDTSASVQCWGRGTIGRADPPAGSFEQISVAGGYACGVRRDQSIECWG